MNRNKITVRRITYNALMLALMCIVGMLSIPLGTNIKISLQLLIVFIVALTCSSFIDCLIITGLYLVLGLFAPIYAGFISGITPTFGFVISFVVIGFVVLSVSKMPDRRLSENLKFTVKLVFLFCSLHIPFPFSLTP